MVCLSKTIGYAVRALVCLAACKTPPLNIKDVANRADVPQAYLAKIVKMLSNSGIILTKRGKNGGIWLARPAQLISLLDVCVALEGKDFLGPCLLGARYASGDRVSPTHQFWIKNKGLILKELERVKLSMY